MKDLLIRLIARKPFQLFFTAVHKLSLAGMNYGGGGDLHSSGEANALSMLTHRFPQKKVIIFDVGANIGEYSTILSEVFKGRAQIYAFEPAKETFSQLKANVSTDSAITPVPFGLGEKKAKLPLYTAKNKSGYASVFNRRLDHYGVEFTATESISIHTLDQFCEDKGIKTIHFLKLDVEGYEISVLKGAEKMLGRKAIKAIQFEFGGCNIDSRTFFQDFYYLLTPHYVIYRIVQNGIVPIQDYSELREIFVNTNYLALLK